MMIPNQVRSTAYSCFALLAAVAMSAAWLIPNHYPPWWSSYNEGAMGISLLLFAVAMLCRGRLKGIPLVPLVVAAVAVLPWLQWSFGLLLYSGDAWVCTLFLLGFSSAVAVGYQWGNAQKPN